MGCDGIGRDFSICDGMAWGGMAWGGMGWDRVGWKMVGLCEMRRDGVGCDGLVWDGTGWGGIGWHGMAWHGMGTIRQTAMKTKSREKLAQPESDTGSNIAINRHTLRQIEETARQSDGQSDRKPRQKDRTARHNEATAFHSQRVQAHNCVNASLCTVSGRSPKTQHRSARRISTVHGFEQGTVHLHGASVRYTSTLSYARNPGMSGARALGDHETPSPS